MEQGNVASEAEFSATRLKQLAGWLKIIYLALCTLGILLAIHWAFNITVRGYVMLQNAYYYLLIGIFLAGAYIILPARKSDKITRWYDIIAAIFSLGICGYLFMNSWQIGMVGWFPPTHLQLILAIILALLVLEAGRRAAGSIYIVVCILFGAYPLFAESMPGVLFGVSSPFSNIIASHIYGSDGITGLPAKVIGDYLIGFLAFAGVLIVTGAGAFFVNLALGMLGRFRGGPAKVAVIGSGLFGSLSGSVASNVIATGTFTIPAMKRLGYPPHYAGAVEACSSTGGAIMPPVMGAVAFVMAAFLEIEYVAIAAAAVIPALLYYFSLLIQVDSYAAKVGMAGIPRSEIPSLKKTLSEGWPFIAVFFFLIWGLGYMRWEFMAPWYATGLMIVLSFLRKETWPTPKRLVNMLAGVGTLICQTMAIILPVAFIVNGLGITGTAAAFTAGLVHLGGGNVYFVLLLGVIACYILGMAGLLIAAYVFLAVSLAPALIEIGHLNKIAVHMFLIYYCILSSITPPVAIGAFVAAAVAGSDPMRTAWQSMRLGMVLFFVPFFFLFNPSLVLQGPLLDIIICSAKALLGTFILASAIEGYMLKLGKLSLWARPLLAIGGFLIAFPESITDIIGAALLLCTLAIIFIRKNWHVKAVFR